jgi:hypothetical protein
VLWINEAKKEQTKQNRILKAIEMLKRVKKDESALAGFVFIARTLTSVRAEG